VIGARPPKVSPEAVKRVMGNPPDFIAVSYLPAWRAGRISSASLACGVVAALGHSRYDLAVVDEVAGLLEGLGYGEEPISAVFV
jgi:hypothetical protein